MKVEDNIVGWDRFAGHPLGQAVIRLGEPGSTVELQFSFYGFLAQDLEKISPDLPPVAGVSKAIGKNFHPDYQSCLRKSSRSFTGNRHTNPWHI